MADARELPNGDPGLDPNDYVRAQLDRGRDITDIVRELGIGGDNRPDPQMHAMETGAPPGGALPNGDPAAPGPSDWDKQRMLEAAKGVTQESINSKAGAFTGGPTEGLFVRHLGDSLPGAPAAPSGGMPNGAPAIDPHQNLRLGDQSAPTGVGGGGMPQYDKTTYEFRQGEYTPGKGVADKDGYFDPNFHSEANIFNNARNGDDSAYAKLEVMARHGNGDAAKMLADLGTKDQFLGSKIHADYIAPHNKEINTALGAGIDKGNVEARLNLANQREDFLTHLETTRESNPDAATMMEKLASIGGRQLNFDGEGVTWQDTKGDEHRVPIGRIHDMLPQLDTIIAAGSGKPAQGAPGEDDAAYQATKNKKK